jgi:hypothetical protein
MSPIERECNIEEIDISNINWREIQNKYPSIKKLKSGI